jgi:hypothetical protein
MPEVDSAMADPDARPASVTAAGIILLIAGIFTALIGLVLLIVVVVNANPNALPDYVDAAPDGFAGAAGIIGLVLVAYGSAGSVAAVQALRRRPWARGLGIVLAAVGVVALTVALVRPGQTTGTTPLIFVPVIAALAYAGVALATEARWFGGTR